MIKDTGLLMDVAINKAEHIAVGWKYYLEPHHFNEVRAITVHHEGHVTITYEGNVDVTICKPIRTVGPGDPGYEEAREASRKRMHVPPPDYYTEFP